MSRSSLRAAQCKAVMPSASLPLTVLRVSRVRTGPRLWSDVQNRAVLLGQRSFGAAYAFGTLNGLLPCGLVYVACAGAVATVVSAGNSLCAKRSSP